MLFKILVVVLLLFVVASLFTGMFYLVRDKSGSDRVVKALTVRIALSILVFILLMIGYATGFLSPLGSTGG